MTLRWDGLAGSCIELNLRWPRCLPVVMLGGGCRAEECPGGAGKPLCTGALSIYFSAFTGVEKDSSLEYYGFNSIITYSSYFQFFSTAFAFNRAGSI